MQLLSLERSKTTRLFGATVVILVVVSVLTAKQADPAVLAAGVILGLVSLLPLYLWLLGSSHGLPIWPVYVLANGITGALPMVQDPQTLDAYDSTEIIVGGLTMVGFILLGSLVWVSLTSRTPTPPKSVLMIQQHHSVRYLLMFVYVGVLFLANQLAWWFTLPGNSMQVARGVANSLNWMGLFVLSYYHGRGLLDRSSLVFLVIGAVLTIFLNLTSLMLAQAIVPVALAIAGYTLGSNKLPWRLLLVVFVAAALLHPGKYQMRLDYWPGGGNQVGLTTLPSFFQAWFGYGFQEVGGAAGLVKAPPKEEKPSSLFERAGSLHMLLLVQQKSPNEVPFLNGITYEPIPRLLIPRFLDKEKGISHAGNVLLTVNYGLQTIEQTSTTSIYWGLVPEAYANFGYLGVAALAALLASFLSLMTRLSVGVPMTSLRFVIGLLVLAASTKADTMGVFVTTQFQAMMGITMASLVLMRRQTNPFAVGPQHEVIQTAARAQQQLQHENAKVFGPAKWGGHKPPKWAPLSHRKAYELAAARRKAETTTDVADEKNADEGQAPRPRQVAVPIQPYYYRSRKA